MRKMNERDEDWDEAEKRLGQIVQIREKAGHGLKASLNDKHNREEIQIEHQNQLELEEFAAKWDQIFIVYQREAISKMEALRQQHANEMVKAREYLEKSKTFKHKKSAQVLNLEQIRDKLIK